VWAWGWHPFVANADTPGELETPGREWLCRNRNNLWRLDHRVATLIRRRNPVEFCVA